MNNSEIMRRPHWAIISNVSVYHEGDERSRTHPGHGYPAHTTTHMEYTPYATEEEALEAIRRKQGHDRFTVIKAAPYRVETDIKLSPPPNLTHPHR
jgi:hypothetical protein